MTLEPANAQQAYLEVSNHSKHKSQNQLNLKYLVLHKKMCRNVI